jgi:hypothetical protein
LLALKLYPDRRDGFAQFLNDANYVRSDFSSELPFAAAFQLLAE